MKKLIKVKYSSNNSGGSWWLEDKDWKALEKAGWEVEWGDLEFCGNGKKRCSKRSNCQGHRKFSSWKKMMKKDRWLGCLARGASKKFTNITEALEEFERVTGQEISDEGCNCCGSPHSFSWEDEKGDSYYVSGKDLLTHLYPGKKIPGSLREAIEN